FRVGGPQVRFAQIANHFGGRYRHLIVAMDQTYDARALLAGDVEYEIGKAAFEKGRTLRNTWLFRRTLAKWSPDLLITYNWGAMEWALANYFQVCPHIHIEDGFGPEEARGQLARRVLFRRFVLARANRLVLPSRTLSSIAETVWRLSPRQLAYIPN